MRIRQPVFVILPLGDKVHVTRLFREGVAPALRYFGFEPKRVDAQAIGGGIIEEIQRQIAESYFVVADLSFARPNCYYEVGYAHCLKKPVLLLKDETTQLHFNISNRMVHRFTKKTALERFIKRLIPKFLETAKRQAKDDRNGKFGRRCIRKDYRLSATVNYCKKKTCELTFEVTSLDDSRPLEGEVKFYMHSSYTKRVQQIRAKEGIARYENVTSNDGPWTLGAEVLRTGTRLELDLATISGAKKWWYREAYKIR